MRIIQQGGIVATCFCYYDSLLLLAAWVVLAICALVRWDWKDGLRRCLHGDRDGRAPRLSSVPWERVASRPPCKK